MMGLEALLTFVENSHTATNLYVADVCGELESDVTAFTLLGLENQANALRW